MIESESSFTTRKSGDAISKPNLLCCYDAGDATRVKPVATASTYPICVCQDTAAAAGDVVQIRLLGCGDQSYLCIAAGAIAAGVPIYTAPSGKVQVLPVSAGTYWYLGYSLSEAAGNNSLVRCVLGIPEKLVVAAQP